jgi:hypothetical protein
MNEFFSYNVFNNTVGNEYLSKFSNDLTSFENFAIFKFCVIYYLSGIR